MNGLTSGEKCSAVEKKRKVLVPSSFPQSCFIIPLSLAVEKKSWKREKARRIFGKESW